MGNIFLREFSRLQDQVMQFGRDIEEQVKLSVKGLEQQDKTIAQHVIDNDEAIDEAEVVLEEECLKILALYGPVATDLRYIIATLKINNDFERMADLAVSVAKRTLRLVDLGYDRVPEDVTAIYTHVRTMLRKSMLSLFEKDVEIARSILETDRIVNHHNRKIYHDFVTSSHADEIERERNMLFLTVGKRYERISELTTNIAEDVIYIVEGEIIRHHRNRAEP